MRILVVYCHPVPTSYAAALRDCALAALARAGHETRLLDLYREGFDPVMSPLERERYLTDGEANIAGVQPHVDALRWAEGLLFVFPTWYFGPPAMLKGWLERTWLPGVAFRVPRFKGDRQGPLMQHVRWLGVITTSGSPRWWLFLLGDPVRRLFARALRALFARRCRVQWLQLYSMNNTTPEDRARFLARVDRVLART